MGKNKIEVRYIPSKHQPADIFTKALRCDRFQNLRNKLHVVPRHASLAELAAYLAVFTHLQG